MSRYHMQNRREREITSEPEINRVLKQGKFVTIALCRGNEPYIVTMSYGYDASRRALYFHCATKGLKLEFIHDNPRVCATIIEDGGYIVDECAHAYRSVVLWGGLSVVKEQGEREHGMRVLIEHLESTASQIERLFGNVAGSWERMQVLKLEIDEMTGKAGR
ncbi:MAG: pyridoxamine 5'-phosphate oxidase family protein [candidate division KSB1 bacterium]|nr:pyridoxamine 5'-phosphate oxidase family protein [candidate division KSB1 bacterium]